MKKTVKFLSLLLVIALIIPCVQAFAYVDPQTYLSTVYGDGMLFKQNSEAVFSGTCPNGALVTAQLIAPDGATVLKTNSVNASKSGTFTVTLPTPKGSFEEYSIRIYVNKVLFKVIKDVVFGEVWLASGQSNMSYPLSQAQDEPANYYGGVTRNKWIRALLMPQPARFEGVTGKVPYEPQNDIEGAYWTKGDSKDIYGVSAAAYYFADKLSAELGVPVGILNASLGGSSISTWLSRSAIDGNAAVKNDFVSANDYITAEKWKENEINQYIDMTANFNLAINPLRVFRISGMIWYQGESNVFWEEGRYARAFTLMQESYTKLFRHENGLLPIVWTSLCSYDYGDDFILNEMNIEFTRMQKEQPSSRGLITIHDVPLDYYTEVGSIHPAFKRPVGERMASSALSLVYGKGSISTSPTVSGVEFKDGAAFVTFSGVGEGLRSSCSLLRGFTLSGSNGAFMQADAEIVSADTVKVTADGITEPAGVAYAYGLQNASANLYAESSTGELVPAALFRYAPAVSSPVYFKYSDWLDSEKAVSFRVLRDTGSSGYYDLWKSDKADVEVTPGAAYTGEAGLEITADGGRASRSFTVSPVNSFKDGRKEKQFTDGQSDYSGLGSLSFFVKNDGGSDVTLKEIRFLTSGGLRYSPALCGEDSPSAVIPADGEWHEITADLNSLYLTSNKGGARYSNNKLKEVKDIEFRFENDSENAVSLCADNFRFGAEQNNYGTRFGKFFGQTDNVFEWISAWFTYFLGIASAVLRVFGVKC